MKVLFVCLCLMFTSVAQAFSGNDLYEKMISDSSGDKTYSYGFVQGFVTTTSLMRTLVDQNASERNTTPDHSLLICFPEGATLGQISDLIEKYLRENPDKRHWNAAALSHNALISKWRCQ